MPINLEIIGTNAFISVAGIKNIPAKVDTGADSSAIWASNISMSASGELSFTLFSPESPLYTGELISTSDFSAKRVRSSNGATQIRYRVTLPAIIGSKTLPVRFTLADRKHNKYPVLIGRRTLDGNFLVDVSQSALPHTPAFNQNPLNQELKADPLAFHRKYFKN